ncbi:hypothetical protein H5410_040880, partial [Solanum commersonii]
MNIHNKTQFTHAKINCVLKDLCFDKPFPKNLIVAILATWAKVNQFKIKNQMQRSHSKRGTQCMISPIGLPYFPIDLRLGSLKIKKVFLSLVMGLSAK